MVAVDLKLLFIEFSRDITAAEGCPLRNSPVSMVKRDVVTFNRMRSVRLHHREIE